MRKKFIIPKAGAKLSIANSYRTYLAKLMSRGKYNKFNFFADILSGLQTQEDSETATFSMQVHKGHYLMKYSPSMVDELDEFGAGVVIAHELGHAALFHIPRMIRIYDMFSTEQEKLMAAAGIVHLAADYALNSWLIDVCGIFTLKDLKTRIGSPREDLGTFLGAPLGSYAGIHPSDVGLPNGKSMEWYVNALSKRILDEPWDVTILVDPGVEGDKDKKSKGNSSAEGKGKGKGMLGNLSQAASQMTSEQLEELLQKAGIDPSADIGNLMNVGEDGSISELADQLTREFTKMMAESAEATKSRGTLPGNIKQFIDDLLRPPQVDWRQELRSYCRSAKPSRSKTTLSRPKRRHICIEGIQTPNHPGKRKNPSYRIIFAIDTSGSVGNAELQEIFGELRGILSCNEGTEVTVVECDTRIGRIYTLDSTGDVDTNVSGRGGTSFDPVFSWIKGDITWNSMRCPAAPDLLIYATDGECSLPPTHLRIPQGKMLWLLSSRGRVPGSSWGSTPTKEVRGFAEYGRFIKVNSLQ